MKNPWLYAGALALVVVVIFSGFVFSDKMLYSSDQLGGLDARMLMRTSLIEHQQLPLWFSVRLGGMPTIDALFGDALYPFSVVMNVLFPIDKAIGYKMILHIFLAGLFFFLMLRRGFGVAAPLAFVGGVFYMLNPEFFSHIYPGHDGKMFVIAWLPFIVWRLKALTDRPSLLNATLLGGGIGMSILTSHVQMTYFVLWGAFAFVVFALIRRVVARQTGSALRLGGFALLAVAIGLAIGFIQLFPSVMYVREMFSVRGADRGFAYAASWSLHWPEFFSLWVPEFGNTLDYYWGGNPFKLNSEYAGGIVLLLAALAVAWRPKPWRWFWLSVAVFSVLYSMGANTPFFRICYEIIPGVKKFRAGSMMMFWFSFGTILLALLFLKDLLSGAAVGASEAARKKQQKGLLITLGVFFCVTVLFSMKDLLAGLLPFIGALDTQKRQIFDANFDRNFVPMLWLWFFFAAATIGILIALVRGKVKPALAVGIVFAIGVIDVARVDARFIKLISSKPYMYTEPALRNLQREMEKEPFRVFSLPGALPQNGAGVHGLEGVGGFHDNELRWYREFRGEQDRNFFESLIGVTPEGQPYLKADELEKGNPFLNLANAKYLLVRNGRELIAIENRQALRRLSFAPNHTVMDSAAILAALRGGTYDYRTTVALLEPPLNPPVSMPDSLARALPPLAVKWQTYTPNERVATVNVPADGFLRIAEVYYPGWKIYVDGKETPPVQSDLAWMAVAITAGEHVVTMQPRSLYLGTAIRVTAPIVVLLCVFWTVAVVKARRKRVA